ncbi:6760_t:CDS:10 [Acaulospora morrowiae]|uniref:RNA helicase n=1 Tax=Acaulospora morrowiae TaxID=94023 RepID=A0A9N9A3X4_9GLOM|nr:6760_t:CDS:10 [Acaulospora morrowiae]
MARHSRSRSRSRSPHKKRKHSHRHDRNRSRERTKDSISEKSRDRSRSRERRSGREKDRHKDDREHKRSRHSRGDEKEDAHVKTQNLKGYEDKKTRLTRSSSPPTHESKNANRSPSSIMDTSFYSLKSEDIHATSISENSNGGTESHANTADFKSSDSATSATVAALLDQEEKIRQRRERVEQWRKEREAAKLAEEAAKAKTETNTGESSTVDEETKQNLNKGWTLDDDDEDETMEVDGAPESVDLMPIPKPVDKTDSPVSQVRRNPLLGLGNRKSNFKGKGKEGTVEEEKNSVSSSKVSNAEDTSDQLTQNNSADEDPLDAFMKDVEVEVEHLNEQDKKRAKQVAKGKSRYEKLESVQDEGDVEEEVGSDPEDILALAAKKLKKKDLAAVDHAQVKYEPFRKDFYIEPPEMHDLTPDQVDLIRVELGGIKIRGIDCPKPIQKWTHAGLPAACLQVIKKLNFEKPTPIQSQAIPAIMAGRDVIGVAKTGSGKTIAFLLPMFRHIKDQRPLDQMEGPVAIIMTPTRELAVQIHKECKHFLKGLNLRAVCAYGGSPIKDQIAELKRGAEIIVCTPGRMIDLLCANSGRVTNLKRVTYLVLDEADRMFDMGFEPQVMKIVNNVRPDRQTVLFSATFPRQMESLARKVLKKPLEITVGGRSVVAQDVTQIVEVREDSTKFVRLLEILGQQYNDDPDARALIFVDRQEAADNLLRDLIRKGYPCMSLHGGKDQLDRDSTIADFKSGVCQLLIATSVAARGLDVKQLKLVINFECPNHMEDYVHRVGRTGRAGNKGTAYTFITPEQDRYAMDIVKALKLSGAPVIPELQKLADGFQEKVKAGSATYSSSGFGGKGLERLDEARDLVKKAQRKTYGDADDDTSEDEIEEDDLLPHQSKKDDISGLGVSTNMSKAATAIISGAVNGQSTDPAAIAALKAAQEAAARVNAKNVGASGVQRAKDIIADINARFKENSVQGTAPEADKAENAAEYSVEIEINDYPQKARWKVTNKEQISQITELTGAAITTRGTYFPPGRQPAPGSGERKLYLFVEGENEYVVEKAKNEIKRILTETTLSAIEAEARNPGSTSLGGYGKYTVV